MSEIFRSAEVSGELVSIMEQTDARPTDDMPFRVLMIGDWSGRANRKLFASTDELKGWRPLLVDRDNVDQLMARLGVKLYIPLTVDNTQSLTINFEALDDFHPDDLFRRLEVFEDLQQIRARLENPRTFAAAAAELRARGTVPETGTSVAPPPAKEMREAPRPAGSLLDQILEGPASASTTTDQRPPDVSAEISELARTVVKPFLSPAIEPDQQQLMAAIDSRITEDMNAILHNGDFKALEAAWRAVDFLVRRLDTLSQLKLYLLDISLEELKADVSSHEDIRASAIYKILVDQTNVAGGLPWAAVVANYTFDIGGIEPAFVERVSQIAKEAGAPFVAGTTARLLGCESLVRTPDPKDWTQRDKTIEDKWKELRKVPASEYIGLALPRFLLRLPYGKDTDPIEAFGFEEMPASKSEHESYLWANAAFAIAYVLARGFSESGWNFRPADFLDIEGLPLHVYEHGGESELKPCAEVLLTLRAAETIIDRGLMPLLTLKDTDTVHVGMVQSIAGRRLAGRWNDQ